MVLFDTIQRAVSGLLLGLVLLGISAMGASAQELRTQNLLLDDDALTSGTRNTITLRAPADAGLNSDYVLRFPDQTGLGIGSMLFIEDYTASVATARWLASSPSSVLTTDASGLPVWQSLSSLLASVTGEWSDGDSIGVGGIIYATQALGNGSADTVAITDAGNIGVGTTSPDALLTLQGADDLFTAKDIGGSLRSVLNDDGQHDWFLGTFTGEAGQARVGITSGFPSFTLFRPGNTDRFDMLNRSLYTALGYNADGVDTGGVLNIAQGGNVGVGVAAPTAKLHVSAASDPLRLQGLIQDNNLDSILVVDGQGVIHWMPSTSFSVNVLDTIIDNAWLLTGNTGTVDGTNFLGTTDDVPLNFRVNNARAFRIEPTLSDPNIIGGPSTNSVTAGVVGATISGGTSHTNISGDYAVVAGGSTNSLTANYGVIGGGRNNDVSGVDATVGGGQRNTASGSDATVGGGEDNVASGDISTVSGGDENSATGYAATVSGGESNTAQGNYATLNGGEDNLASGHYSTISGGWQDTASGYASTIAGGEHNLATGSRASVGGGQNNNASGSRAVVSGGQNNLASEGYTTVSGGFNDTASGYASTVAGGEYNVATGSRAAIGGGGENNVTGNYSTISGGMDNTISGAFSAVPGGRGLTISGDGAFGFLGDNDAGTSNMTVADADVAVFGNTDLWLANNNNGASALRFYEANSSTGTFPGATNYSSFEAQSQSSNIRYILPDTAGIAGDVLGVGSVVGSTVTLDWTAGSSGGGGNAWLLVGNAGTNPNNNFLGTTDNVRFEIRVNNARALRIDPRTASPNITGGFNGNSITTNDDGNVISGGGVAGATNVLNGVDYSAIGGGVGNQMYSNSNYSVIGGGDGNRMTSTSNHSVIGGGEDNQLDNSQHSVVGGGNNNRMNSGSNYSGIFSGNNIQINSGDYAFIGGGNNNQMNSNSDYSSIVGGNNIQISSSDYGVVGGGNNNQLNSNSDYSSVVGGSGNQISSSTHGVLGGGNNNQLNSGSDYSVLGGGQNIQITGSDYAAINGGRSNIIGSGADYSFIGAGQNIQIGTADWAVIGGGSGNQTSSTSHYSFIGSGINNRISSASDRTSIVGGASNQADNAQWAFIGGGNNNRLSSNSDYTAILTGNNNQIDNSSYGLVGSGNNNRLTSNSSYSAILAGSSSQIDNGQYSFIGGGTSIQLTSGTSYAVVGGGQSNTMDNSAHSFIGGGESNTMNGATHSILAGGRQNSISGDYATLTGGRENTLTGNYSAVPGGRGLTLTGIGSFGFLGGNIGGNNMSLSENNTAVFGNTDLWLANNDNSASALRLYEPNSSTGSFPAGTNYSSIRAQAQAQDIEYIFPDTAGIVGDFLVVKAVSGTQVTLDWATPNETQGVGTLLFARKTADETVTGTTLQNDDHLIVALQANSAYEVSGALYCEQISGNADLNLAWTVPGGTGTGAGNSTMLISFYAFERKNGGNRDVGGDVRTVSGTGAPDAEGEVDLGNNLVTVHFTGIVITGTNSGNLTLQWAPTSGTTNQVRLLKNSFMSVTVAQ